MIKIENLKKSFGQNKVLDGISLTINEGEVVAIIGPSGAGKSTLLRSINLLEKPEQGLIQIEDLKVDVQKSTKAQIRNLRQSTAMVFQQFNLFHRKTALENVMEGLLIVKQIPKEEAKALAVTYLNKVGLSDRMDYYPKQLSGGQQQRVAIARALAMRPKLLLFDEPTSALDPELVGEVLDTIRATAVDGNTMIIVSHEMNFVRKVANRVLFLEKGKIIEDGSPKEVFENPKNDRTRIFLSNFYQMREPEYTI
jgi:polar amino acid transport system ATP-binding protein